MTTTASRTNTAPPSRRVRMHLGVGAVLAVLALTACSPDGTTEPTEQESPMQSMSPEPTASGTDGPGSATSVPAPGTPAPGTGGTSSGAPSAPASDAPAAAGTNALLTVTISQDATAEPVQYVLECVDGAPGPATTLPGAENACAALARLGTGFFTARPAKDVICTQQYGGPQTASITGELDGTSILATFSLTDGCLISRWNSVQDILGAPGAL